MRILGFPKFTRNHPPKAPNIKTHASHSQIPKAGPQLKPAKSQPKTPKPQTGPKVLSESMVLLIECYNNIL